MYIVYTFVFMSNKIVSYLICLSYLSVLYMLQEGYNNMCLMVAVFYSTWGTYFLHMENGDHCSTDTLSREINIDRKKVKVVI